MSASKSVPGSCGGGEAETDSDGDGFPDRIDECTQDHEMKVHGVCVCVCVCGYRIEESESDSDDDGVSFFATNAQRVLTRRFPVCVVPEK
jgi:hypothetical protein